MCADAPNRGGLSASWLARDFGTTISRGAVSFCEGNAIAGHGTPAVRVVSGRDFQEGGSGRDPPSALSWLSAGWPAGKRARERRHDPWPGAALRVDQVEMAGPRYLDQRA